MGAKKTFNWFRGNGGGGGVRRTSGGKSGACVDELLKLKSVPELNAERRTNTERSQSKDVCPIQTIRVWDMTEARKNELLARYGLGNESKRMDFQRKVTGR